MKISTSLVSLFFTTTLISCANPWSAKHEGSSMGQRAGMDSGMMTVEAQTQMAKLHNDAARCLRDGKSSDQCHDLMMKSQEKVCKEMGSNQCREMGMMMGGR